MSKATFDQARKILSLVESASREEMQKLIESSLLSQLIELGPKKFRIKQHKELWDLICLICPLDKVFVTIAKDGEANLNGYEHLVKVWYGDVKSPDGYWDLRKSRVLFEETLQRGTHSSRQFVLPEHQYILISSLKEIGIDVDVFNQKSESLGIKFFPDHALMYKKQ